MPPGAVRCGAGCTASRTLSEARAEATEHAQKDVTALHAIIDWHGGDEDADTLVRRWLREQGIVRYCDWYSERGLA